MSFNLHLKFLYVVPPVGKLNGTLVHCTQHFNASFNRQSGAKWTLMLLIQAISRIWYILEWQIPDRRVIRHRISSCWGRKHSLQGYHPCRWQWSFPRRCRFHKPKEAQKIIHQELAVPFSRLQWNRAISYCCVTR